jgi:hypothetical protein
MMHAPELCPHCGSPSAPRLLVSHIQATVAAYYQIPVRCMTADSRGGFDVSHPRQLAMYLCAQLTPKSTPHIGRLFGNRDHTTVMHAIRAVKRRMDEDAELAEDVRLIRERLSPVSTVIHSPKEPDSEKVSPGSGIEQTVKAEEQRLAA